MADQAQELLAGSGWLPEPLRTPGRAWPMMLETSDVEARLDSSEPSTEPAGEETAANDGETAVDEPETPVEDEPAEIEPPAIAAE